MAHFIYRKRAPTNTAYVEVMAQDGDPLTPDEALIVTLQDLALSLDLIASQNDNSTSNR